MQPRKKKQIIIKKKKRKNKPNNAKNNNDTEENVKQKSTTLYETLKKDNVLERRITGPIYCKKEAVGLDRLICPYNKFRLTKPPIKTNTKMFNSSPYKKDGLSPQERTYLICSCRRLNRYQQIKAAAQEAIKHKKIFTIHGHCDYVRTFLVQRGWVEKIPQERMDVNSIRYNKYKDDSQINYELERLLLSNLVEKYPPNFIWNAKDDIDAYRDRENLNVFYNRLKQEAAWTSKQGLCASIKQKYWFHIEGLADVNVPRTYTSTSGEEKEEFEEDYKMTACTSLLKWILSMVANNRPVFSITGRIGLNVIIFALNRCKEYLFDKQHKYIDNGTPPVISSGQWNAFLKKYYILIAKQDTFKLDTENKLPTYLEYAKYLLKEIVRYRPQLTCEGCHNIWIIKPTHLSRGRGIRMASKLGVLTDLHNRGKYVFQKYIEEPLLIHETKFDIRQYYLISSTVPLVIWMYKDCYLKFSSQKYSLKNYHEAIHLTNNAVQRKYQNCNDRHPELPDNNMWSLQTYKEYLRKRDKEYIWDKVIYPGMKKSIVGSMLTCQDTIIYAKNRFELYGCDFILDKDYKPWLIEINSSPDLNPTTKVTAEICPAVISDMIKVVIDRSEDSKASTGMFECIYRQTLCTARAGVGELLVRGYSLPSSYFYKGDLELVEEYNDANIGILPSVDDSDISSLVHANQQDNLDSLIAEDGNLNLKSIASVITSQLNMLMDRMTSCNSDKKSNLRGSFDSSPSSNNLRKSSEHVGLNNPTNKNAIIGKRSRCASMTDLRAIKTSNFDFSQLDDGPFGNGSGLVNTHPVVNHDKRMKEYVYNAHKQNVETVTSLLKNNTLDATKKLILFLERKKHEYAYP